MVFSVPQEQHREATAETGEPSTHASLLEDSKQLKKKYREQKLRGASLLNEGAVFDREKIRFDTLQAHLDGESLASARISFRMTGDSAQKQARRCS